MSWLISYRFRKIHSGKAFGPASTQMGEIRDGFEVSDSPPPVWLWDKKVDFEFDHKRDHFAEHQDVLIIHSAIEFDDSDLSTYPDHYDQVISTSRIAER